jgi:hypothetical protein
LFTITRATVKSSAKDFQEFCNSKRHKELETRSGRRLKRSAEAKNAIRKNRGNVRQPVCMVILPLIAGLK